MMMFLSLHDEACFVAVCEKNESCNCWISSRFLCISTIEAYLKRGVKSENHKEIGL